MTDGHKLRFLSDDALDGIECTAHRLLEEVGIALEHSEAQERLRGLGCRVEGERTHIPGDVVAWAMENVVPHRDFYGVDGAHSFFLDGDGPRFHNSGGVPFTIDLETGRRRPASLQDVADMSRLLDALPNVDVIAPMYSPQDVPSELVAVAVTDTVLRHTRKPLLACCIDDPEEVSYVVRMAAACCGGMEVYREHPTMSLGISPVSPLRFPDNVTASIMAVARSGTPFSPLPAPSLGATSPITMAGALAQQHAELLASFVIAAAASPGARVVYCSRISPIDLRTAVSSWGGPEVGLTGACAGQLARGLGLACDAYGFATSAQAPDAQFAYERLSNAMMPALGGVEVVSGVGSADDLMVGALEIAVIDNELIDLLNHVVPGCRVDEETLAFDVSREVIGGDGVFLGERHTLEQIRLGATWLPTVSQRAWASERPGDGVVARARVRATEIMDSHEADPLPDDVTAHLDEILDEARRILTS